MAPDRVTCFELVGRSASIDLRDTKFSFTLLPWVLIGASLFSTAAVAAEDTNPNSDLEAHDKRWFLGGETGLGGSNFGGQSSSEIHNFRNANSASDSAAFELGGFAAMWAFRASSFPKARGPITIRGMTKSSTA